MVGVEKANSLYSIRGIDGGFRVCPRLASSLVHTRCTVLHKGGEGRSDGQCHVQFWNIRIGPYTYTLRPQSKRAETEERSLLGNWNTANSP